LISTRKNKEKRLGRHYKYRWILLLVLIALCCLGVYQSNTTVGVTHYKIISDRLPEAFNYYKIVQLSDLHDAQFGENHMEVVNHVKMSTPDVIFITGDFIDSNRYDLEQSLLLVEELQHVAPLYYVTGNHEIATNDLERIKGALEEWGVRVLTDDADVITLSPGNSIAIGGIEDPLANELEDNLAIDASIRKAFEQVPANLFKVLLSHRPEQFDVYAEQGIDLTFSGHAHGGQFRIPGIGGLVSPGQGWFPKYTAGVQVKNGSHMIVSRGLGNSIIPVRIFNQPEIVIVTLQQSDN
jgi:uncharacterized protein